MNDREKEFHVFHLNSIDTIKKMKDEWEQETKKGKRVDKDKLNKLRERFLKVCVEYCDKYDELFGIYEG